MRPQSRSKILNVGRVTAEVYIICKYQVSRPIVGWSKSDFYILFDKLKSGQQAIGVCGEIRNDSDIIKRISATIYIRSILII